MVHLVNSPVLPIKTIPLRYEIHEHPSSSSLSGLNWAVLILAFAKTLRISSCSLQLQAHPLPLIWCCGSRAPQSSSVCLCTFPGITSHETRPLIPLPLRPDPNVQQSCQPVLRRQWTRLCWATIVGRHSLGILFCN